MEIKNKSLMNLYMKEFGKLLLEFPDDRYMQYIDIIMRTKSYREIIENIPSYLTKIEKAYYVYTKLGSQLYENNSLVYNHINNLSMYYGTIKDNGVGNCRQMSELFVTMLLQANIIEAFYLTRKPVGVEQLDLRHIDAIIQVDGKLYMTDIIRDTVNMRAGIRNSKFGYIDTREKRVLELKKYIFSNNYISDDIKIKLILLINDNNYEELLNFVKTYKDKNEIDIGVTYFERKIPKLDFASQIENEVGILTKIPQKSDKGELSIEYLDEITNNVRQYEDVGFPFNFSLQGYHYFEDILAMELIPKMLNKDSYIRRGWSISRNKLLGDSLDESIELDVDIILNFFYKIAPKIDSEICLKYLKITLEEIYNSREEYKSIVNREWLDKHIKLYQTIRKNDIEEKNEEFPLQTLFVIRKDNPTKEKYLFYKFKNEGEPQKAPYREILEFIKQDGTKICSKFSSKRGDVTEELEL